MSKVTINTDNLVTPKQVKDYTSRLAKAILTVKYKGAYSREVSPSTFGYKIVEGIVKHHLKSTEISASLKDKIKKRAEEAMLTILSRWRPDKAATAKINKMLNDHLEHYLANMSTRKKDALIVKHLTIKK